MSGRLRILTWHTHGAYLHGLTQAPHEFYVLSKPGHPPGYAGRNGELPWGANVHDLPAEQAKHQPLDCVVFQTEAQYLEDQYELLSPAQQRLPRIYVEHDPPREHPVDARHPVDAADVMIVHVTHFNRLMWNNGRTPTRVIEQGVIDPGYRYTGELAKGLVVINNLRTRGRRLGSDVFSLARKRIPLDLIGIGSEEVGGLGDVLHAEVPAFAARYRFLFSPVRYASLGFGVIEAMMTGLPVVALATAEMATVIRNGVNGFIDTDPEKLLARMQRLLQDEGEARHLGEAARSAALERFSIHRFVEDWDAVLAEVAGMRRESFVA